MSISSGRRHRENSDPGFTLLDVTDDMKAFREERAQHPADLRYLASFEAVAITSNRSLDVQGCSPMMSNGSTPYARTSSCRAVMPMKRTLPG